MKSSRNKSRGAFAAAVAGIALVVTGCASSDGDDPATPDTGDGGGGGDASLEITFLPKNLGNPYFDTSSDGGEEAINEFGGTFAEVGRQRPMGR